MVTKRPIYGHRQAKPARKIEVAIFMPPELFEELQAEYAAAPGNVSFSALVVAKIEAGMER